MSIITRRCPQCSDPVREWDRMVGGNCVNCKQRARLGDRDDERVVVAPALAAQLVDPSPPEQAEPPPAAVSAPAVPLLPQPCRCGNSHKVTRNGLFAGWCEKCSDNARQKLRTRGDGTAPQSVLAFLEAGPLRVDAPPRKPRANVAKKPAGPRPAPAAPTPSIAEDGVEYPLRYCVPAWAFKVRQVVTFNRWMFNVGQAYLERAQAAA